jgi:hypothetical protein
MACELDNTLFEWAPAHEPDPDDDWEAFERWMEDYEDVVTEEELIDMARRKKRKHNHGGNKPSKPYTGGGVTASSSAKFAKYSNFNWDHEVGGGCSHHMDALVIPSRWDDSAGESVTFYLSAGSKVANSQRSGATPDFGLYADRIWNTNQLTHRNEFIAWPDYGVPASFPMACEQIMDAFIRACRGERVELGCIGGHGRTGTLAASMAVLAGFDPSEAVRFVRKNYCTKAVETGDQELFVSLVRSYFFGVESKEGK